MEVKTQHSLSTFDFSSHNEHHQFSCILNSGISVFSDLREPECVCSVSNAAMKVQKVYRSYRTRPMLADSAVVAEVLWWQAIDYARLNHSTVSSFNFLKPETASSRWNRISLNASKVGKGLSKDAKAQKLAFQHWIEVIDPRHRYGHNLHIYYEEWCKTDSGSSFGWILEMAKRLISKNAQDLSFRSKVSSTLDLKRENIMNILLLKETLRMKKLEIFLIQLKGCQGQSGFL